MRFLPKRHTSEEVGRRRPLPGGQEQGRNRAFSYYSSRMPGESSTGRTSAQEALENRHKRRNWRRVVTQTPAVLAILVVAVCAFSELSLSSTPNIVTLTSSSGQLFLRPNAVYQQAAAKFFNRSWSNRNKLTVDTAGISRALEHEFPELSSASVALPILGHKPVVYVQPVEPTLILKTVNGRFLIDNAGRALVTADAVGPKLAQLSLPSVTDQTGIQAQIGAVALPSTDTAFIHTVAAQLSARNISVSKFVLPPAASELDAYFAGAHYYAKFNMQNDPLQQAGTFIAAQRHLLVIHKTPAQYVDVRINGRVYYK